MKIISMHVMKWDEQNPIFLCSAYELGFVSWYQRPFFKETLNFGVRTTTARVQKGQRTAVSLDDAKAKCYVCVDQNNIGCLVVTDDQYPDKVPFIIINEMYKEFFKLFTPMEIDAITQDSNLKFERLDQMIKEYQDYTKADKLAQLENTLKEINEICHKNIGELMRKGEKLETLMAKSKDMSAISCDFYKKAKQTNQRCCILI